MIKNQLRELNTEKRIERFLEKIAFRLKQREYEKAESIGNGGNRDYAHVTYCVATNSGDTVLSQCVRKTIGSFCKMSGWRILPVTKEVTGETIKNINECEKLIIGGGGLFLPDTNKNSISGWQWAISKEQLRQITIPVCVFSVGYNYFRGQETNELFIESLCELAHRSCFFGLRNTGSVEAISNLLPKNLADKITFQPCTTTLIRKLYGDILPPKKETGTIAINMAFDRENLRFKNNMDRILYQVANGIKEIQKRGYKIYYICHCWDDDKFVKYLYEADIRYELVDLSRKYPLDVYRFYNNIDLVIGMRGHAQMIPFGLNCEIISLGSHDKMKWFLDDIDAEDWYIDLTENIEHISDNIIEKFLTIHEKNRDITLRRLYTAQENLWDITMNNMTKITRIRE